MAAVRSLHYVRWACVALAATLTIAESFAANDAAPCKAEAGRVVSRQGTVEVRRQGVGDWLPAKLEMRLCDGDAVRTAPRSRAALFIRPENIVRLDQNTAISLRVTDDETIVDFFTNGQVAADPDCGAGYFISRFPRKFKVRTQHVSAEIDGTEFLVRAACEATTVAVYEGAVRTTELSTDRRVLLKALEQITVGPGYRDSIPIRITPRDGVQWTIHYPRLIADGVQIDDPEKECHPSDRVCAVTKAESLLARGRSEEALALLQPLRESRDPDAISLEAVLRIVGNERQEALALAETATNSAPASARTWAALSYARQGTLDLDGSLAAAREAARLSPGSAVAASRVAELLLAAGNLSSGKLEAHNAVQLDPRDARALTIRGFAQLGLGRNDDAITDFLMAVEADSNEPLARLGLGLSKIKGGHLTEGRENLEIAVALDPTASALRTYLGKAYFEENTTDRNKLADRQFRLASELDPRDPSPYLYKSLLALTEGRTIDAFAASEQSARLNDNRAVIRESGLLERDAASRSAMLARVHQELGFSSLALAAGYQSLLDDPGQAAGHRFLADAYIGIPRHEVARASEVLQSQVRQPLSLYALQPQLSEDRVSSYRGQGPTAPGLTEFNPAFVSRNGTGGLIGMTVGEHGTSGHQVLAGFLKDNLSLSAAQVGFGTAGFRPYANFDNQLQNILIHAALTPSLSTQFEFRRSLLVRGDNIYRFDPRLFAPLDDRLQSDLGRLSLRYEFTPNTDVVASFMYADSRETVEFDRLRVADISYVTKVTEAQATTRTRWLKLVGGVTHLEEASLQTDLGGSYSSNPRAQSAYVYSTITPPLPWGRLDVQVGVSQETLDAHEEFGDIKRGTHPKLGIVIATPFGLTLRAAYFEVLKRRFFASQTLEPTQIAGFNQFFDDFNGTSSKRRGIGLDQRFSDRAFAGVELSRRDLIIQQGFTNEYFPWFERRAASYAYWIATNNLSIRAGWEYERLTRSQLFPGLEVFTDAGTRLIPISAQLMLADGVTLSVQTTRVRQTGQFYFITTPGPDPEPGQSQFWLTDLSLQYRLPLRLGVFRLDLRNAFDHQFNYQETDVRLPRFARERTLVGSLTLLF